MVLEIGGERLGRGWIDGAGLRGAERDVVDRTLLVLEPVSASTSDFGGSIPDEMVPAICRLRPTRRCSAM
ncbi:hypothetical protein M2239_007210 [Bradyrhizobium elkanii]|nr:hypothetical protein [Bradyrhizobium elkanii]